MSSEIVARHFLFLIQCFCSSYAIPMHVISNSLITNILTTLTLLFEVSRKKNDKIWCNICQISNQLLTNLH